MGQGYSVKIAECNKELSAVQRIGLKDVSDTIPLGELKDGHELLIKPELYATLDVHNEKSENVDYKVYIIVDKDGKKYSTSSENFWSTFIGIMEDVEEEAEGEDYSIKIFTKPSKNYKGKSFLTCTIV